MPYPTQLPDTTDAPDQYGFPSPQTGGTPWIKTLLKNKDDDVIGVSYQTEISRLTNPADLKEQNSGLALEYYKMMQSHLETIDWVLNGFPTGQDGNIVAGLASTNFYHRLLCQGTVSGTSVTITNAAGPDDPTNFNAQLLFIPATQSQSGQPEWTMSGGLSIHSGIQVTNHNGDPLIPDRRARIQGPITFGPTTTSFTISNEIGNYTGSIQLWLPIADRPAWEVMLPSRGLWTVPTTAKHPAEATGIVELKSKFGESGRIAEPIAYAADFLGTFRVTALINSARTDITDYFVNTSVDGNGRTVYDWQSGAAAKMWIEKSGANHVTKINLDKPGASSYIIEYNAESDPLENLSDKKMFVRSLQSCDKNLRDWTQSLGSKTSMIWTDISPSGEHWYCSVKDQLTAADLADYSWKCNCTKCPLFKSVSKTGGWKPSINLIRKLVLAKNLYFLRPFVGSPTTVIGRAPDGIPSVGQLAGMPVLESTGLPIPDYDDIGNGVAGYLDKTLTLSNFWRLETGYIGNNHTGVLRTNSNSPFPVTPFGDAEIFTDNYQYIASAIPGISGTIQRSLFTLSTPHGWGQKLVQRIRKRNFIIRQIGVADADDGVAQVIDGHIATYDRLGQKLHIDIFRAAWTGDKIIPSQALNIYSVSINNDLVTFNMGPAIDLGIFSNGPGTTGSALYWSSGHTVNLQQDDRPTNWGASDLLSGIGNFLAEKGDGLRITSLPGELANIRLPIISAQAASGVTIAAAPAVLDGDASTTNYTVGAFFPIEWGDGVDPDEESYTVQDVLYNVPGSPFATHSIYFGDFAAVNTGIPPVFSNHKFQQEIADGVFRSFHTIPDLGTGGGGGLFVKRALSDYLTLLLSGIDDKNLLTWVVKYRFPNDTLDRTSANIPFWLTLSGFGGSSFASLPAFQIAARPSALSKIEYFQPFVGWVEFSIIYDGVKTGLSDEWLLPEYGHCHVFSKDSAFFFKPSVDLWGTYLRVTFNYDGAQNNVDISAVPQGNGYSANFLANRTKADQIVCWAGGSEGKKVKAELLANPPVAYAQTVKIDTKLGMPPPVDSVGAPRSVALTATNICENDSVFESDPMGRITFDTIPWHKVTKHDIHITGDFLDSLGQMQSQHLTGMRDSIRALEWVSGASLGGASTFSIGWTLGTFTAPMVNGQFVDFNGIEEMTLDAPLLIDIIPDFPGGTFTATNNDPRPAVEHVSAAASHQIISINANQKMKPEYVAQAIMLAEFEDLQVLVESWTWEEGDQSVTPTGQDTGGWVDGDAGSLQLVGVKVVRDIQTGDFISATSFGNSAAISSLRQTTEGGKEVFRGEVDITEIYKNSLTAVAGETYGYVISGGDFGTPGADFDAYLKGLITNVYATFNETTPFNRLTSGWTGPQAAYGKFQFKGLLVKLNHAGIEADSFPVFAGPSPSLVNPV